MGKNICISCVEQTGFAHNISPHNRHKHVDGKIVFERSLEERVRADIDESISGSKYKYYGITPFRAEGTTLATIMAHHLESGGDK